MDFLFTGITRNETKEQARGKQGYKVQGGSDLLKIRAFLLNITYYQRNANQDHNEVPHLRDLNCKVSQNKGSCC